jgi:hypothetical protein
VGLALTKVYEPKHEGVGCNDLMTRCPPVNGILRRDHRLELFAPEKQPVAYTVWKDGKRIGQTNLELSPGGRRRAGAFVPNEYGLTVLPGISAMLPALMAFGEMCRRRGLNVEDTSPDAGRMALQAFAETVEGQAVIEAARNVAAVELRDSRGQTVVCESLLISDVRQIRALARDQAPTAQPGGSDDGESFYFISVTLATRLRPPFNNRGLHDTPLAVC